MKQSIIALLASATAAQGFGEWDNYKYCAYDKELEVDDEEVPAEFLYSSDQCAVFCMMASEESDFEDGTPMCCDYEKFANGSYACNLYTTDVVFDDDATEYEVGYEEASFLFTSGDYYTLEDYNMTVNATMVEEGCNTTCIDSMLDMVPPESLESITMTCGCPNFFLRYNKAQTLNLAETTAAGDSKDTDPAPATTNPPKDEGNGTATATTDGEPKADEGKGSKTPYVIGGGVGLIALIGGIVYFKKSQNGDQSEGGNFEKFL